MFVRSNDAFTLDTDAARTTGDLTRHVLVGFRARHVLLRILASLHTQQSTATCATATVTHMPVWITQRYLSPGRGDIPGAVLGKNIWGGGLAPHHLGGNNG